MRSWSWEEAIADCTRHPTTTRADEAAVGTQPEQRSLLERWLRSGDRGLRRCHPPQSSARLGGWAIEGVAISATASLPGLLRTSIAYSSWVNNVRASRYARAHQEQNSYELALSDYGQACNWKRPLPPDHRPRPVSCQSRRPSQQQSSTFSEAFNREIRDTLRPGCSEGRLTPI